MNYVTEVNSFYNWLTFNPIPAAAQALWHVLMQMNNKCAVKINDNWYWRVEFTVTNSMLVSILAFSRQQLDNMRNVLIQTGRIVYKKGRGSQCGTYKIIPFDCTLAEDYVDNFPDKVWITPIVSNNFTQELTQVLTQTDTQSLHKPIHNCCTLINNNNKNNNNNIYNNSFCGDDDETRARESNQSADNSLSDYLSEINDYFGITEDIKQEARRITEELFGKYFSRRPGKNDIINVFNIIRHSEQGENGRWVMAFDNDKREILDYAFQQAANAGCGTWAYINGVLDNIRSRGLKTLDDCERYDVDRDVARGKV